MSGLQRPSVDDWSEVIDWSLDLLMYCPMVRPITRRFSFSGGGVPEVMLHLRKMGS